MQVYHKSKKCRICSSKNLELVLDLGIQPPANSFLKKVSSSEKKFPLRLFFCKDCFLLQLVDIVDKKLLFSHYLYLSSASKPILEHFSKYAFNVFNKFWKNKRKPLIIEIGSNDGSLLKEFKKLGANVLGVEPASNVSKIALKSNIPTINKFFTSKLASSLAKKGKPNVILANNVVGHIEDLNDFVLGIKNLLDDDGIFVFEVPYVLDLLKKTEFDTIYHEHLSYFSLLALTKLFKKFELEIFDIQRQSVHGGTLRIFVAKKERKKIKSKVIKMINFEKEYGISKIRTYKQFGKKVLILRNSLQKKIKQLKQEGKMIYGYGAPAKGNVLLNFCQIDNKMINFIIDTTPLKQNLLTPGTHIPIKSPTKVIQKGAGDIFLLLAWNYKKDILKKEKRFRKRGGKFLIPLPNPRII